MTAVAILSQLYELSITAAAIYVGFRYKKVNRSTKLICLLIWLGFLTELIGLYAAKIYHNNYPVYNISCYFEFIVISLYYNYSIKTLREKHIGIYIAVGGVILGIINTLWLQKLTALDSNFLFLECILVVSMSLYSIYRFALFDDEMNLHQQVHFWIAFILLFEQCASLSSWGFYDKFAEEDAGKAVILDETVLSINIITYLSFCALFFRYPKLKGTDV